MQENVYIYKLAEFLIKKEGILIENTEALKRSWEKYEEIDEEKKKR